jgi:hypothetical protein
MYLFMYVFIHYSRANTSINMNMISVLLTFYRGANDERSYVILLKHRLRFFTKIAVKLTNYSSLSQRP